MRKRYVSGAEDWWDHDGHGFYVIEPAHTGWFRRKPKKPRAEGGEIMPYTPMPDAVAAYLSPGAEIIEPEGDSMAMFHVNTTNGPEVEVRVHAFGTRTDDPCVVLDIGGTYGAEYYTTDPEAFFAMVARAKDYWDNRKGATP